MLDRTVFGELLRDAVPVEVVNFRLVLVRE